MATEDLLTLVEAKDILEVDADDHDTELEALITSVSLRLDDLCGPVVIRTITDEKHDGGVPVIYPRYVPIASVSSVTEYSNTSSTVLTAETNSTKPTEGYLLDGPPGGRDVWIRRRAGNADGWFDVGRRNVVITYDAGRFTDTQSVSEKFKRAAGFLLTHLFKSTAPVWHTDQDFFDSPPSGVAVPTFGIPNIVMDMLRDEVQAPEVGFR